MIVKKVARIGRWLGLAGLFAVLLVSFVGVQSALAQWGTTPLPEIGAPAPEFELPDQSGQVRRLADFRGEWVVLYFYPRDFTSGCTIEARRFQQDLPKFQALGAQIVGVSADSVDSHRRFCTAEGLQFPLLSDPEGTVSRAYGSWMGEMALRNTFLIDPDGILRAIDPIVNPYRHSAEVLAQLQELTQAG
ncbi:peroxiredoxin [Synechococcus sp. H60.3]|uniref:peroxiredoxin n=1 Tax=Synechococcus sp. H60.3 TaxID=2967124 RepID=UPI0039C201DF